MSQAYERVFLAIAVAVSAVWLTAQVVQILYPSHESPSSLNTVMVSVAATFFSGSVISTAVRKRRNGNGNGNGKSNGGDDDAFDGPGGYYRAGR